MIADALLHSLRPKSQSQGVDLACPIAGSALEATGEVAQWKMAIEQDLKQGQIVDRIQRGVM